ncbi:methyl-accepting chemotaxis protein [Lachnobacterium bovis]|uniref:methyl-accepting chemotaxis protein n=1 Tax=Lachnobacterium bovis TaxID=140626 RepID=UPI00068D2A6C|nr:methyl-accepting chemotaxis protein [Lachnobacterium bovis]
MREQEFVYADLTKQKARMNRALVIGYVIFAFFIFLISGVNYVAKLNTLKTVLNVDGCTLIVLFLLVLDLKLDKNKERLRYCALFGLILIQIVTSIVYNASYISVLVTAPLIGCILFYDKIFSALAGILVSSSCLGIFLVKKFVLKNVSVEDTVVESFLIAAIILVVAIAYLAVSIGKEFQSDMFGKIDYDKSIQDKMLGEIVSVADSVRNQTNSAMTNMRELEDATGVVHKVVNDITVSNMSTVENVQTQTQMTQNIQESIEETLKYAKDMVEIANGAEEINGNNQVTINKLKEQAATIQNTNSHVATAMDNLQEKTEAVKGIADTIFSISSQTNLLALNASIESARAGEAGRGFAVVADEIRELAEKTRAETETIANVLEELSFNANNAAEAVKESTEATNSQNELITEAAGSFEAMSKSVGELTRNINEIDIMINSLSDANNQIVDNIMQLSSVSQEVASSSEQAQEYSNRNLEKVETTKGLLEKIENEAGKLDKYI